MKRSAVGDSPGQSTKTMRKTFLKSIMRLLAVLMTLLPSTAFAWDFESGGLYYDIVSFTEFTCAVAKAPEGSNYTGNIAIPATVTYNNRELKVVGINKEAFRGCNIESVTGGENLTYVGQSAFSSSKVEKVTLGNNIVKLDDSSFSYCKLLKEFICPELLETIGSNAFYDCTSLKNITFNETLKEINSGAFNSTGLISIEIPSSVTIIGSSVLRNCPNLVSVILPNSIETICLYSFAATPKLQSIMIPPSIKIIEEYAFKDSGIVEVKGGEGLKEIGTYAFYDCKSLVSVDLGISLKTIKTNAFSGCASIKTINSYAPVAPTMASAWNSKVYINSTLNVPEGATAAYANSTNWLEFWNVQGSLSNDLSIFSFQVTAVCEDTDGEIHINGENKEKTFAIGGSDLQLTFIPKYGYQLNRVVVNNVDMTSEVKDNLLTVKGIKEATYITASFTQTFVPMTVSTSEAGKLTSKVTYGSKIEYSFEPSEGWAVHTVNFNGTNVTNQLKGNNFTTSAITEPSEISVVFEKVQNGVKMSETSSAISVYINRGTVSVYGASDSDIVSVFTIDGKLVRQGIEKEFTLPQGASYIVKVGSRTFKLMA